MQRCVLKGEDDELMVDVVEVRVIPQHFEHGCRLPAHGTLTIDVRSGHAWRALEELARTKSAVVLQRPDGGALEMRLGELAKSRNVRVASGSQTSCTVTYCWRSP
ncbi:MAG: hypothetical protein QOH10_212 [Actinomycetota bacterium]|nr:hypothetical protein [Actinomycetota bacterium]